MLLQTDQVISQSEEQHVTQAIASATVNLGFLTILQESNGFLGGYLITNQWGRPLEFRLSTAVQPNRIHQILYGQTLQGYLCGELIGKTLVEKCTAQAHFILTDKTDALHLRPHVSAPVLLLDNGGGPAPADELAIRVRSSQDKKPGVFGHARFPEDKEAIEQLLDRLDGRVDLNEPFARIREAIGEARKMGVTSHG
jgi:hypothetical protein